MSKGKGYSDKVKGAVSKAKGEMKDQVGNAANNQKMQNDGKKDKLKGSAQNASGDHKNREK
ncbi:CsbD family protein [Halobacillus amylolyticus]|uniref:CsbD family protein n=1 Tax=Halobacillus amylolyticus TaxID=2932259 RepID=A0ABY4HGW1_9BACI|nr:CsbD family protein [Halobacillus amylolyticus]UOR13533.1 CsbD family protein [Halobacillus amylolyticus]